MLRLTRLRSVSLSCSRGPAYGWRAAFALALLALPALPLGACSSHGGADAGAPAVDAMEPLPVPAGHVGDLFVGAPGAAWAKARGNLGQAALFLPQSFGGLVANLVGLPITLSGEIDETVPMIGVATRQAPGPVHLALAVHVKAGDRFIGQLTRGESARFNAVVDPASRVTLLTDKVAPESARFALGVFGNYLLVAATAADLGLLGPYVVRTLGPAPAPADDLAMELSEAALAGPVRDEARELRGKSEGPVATVIPLAGLLDTALTLLGDASHGHVGVNIDAAAIHGRITLTPKPGGPASKLVADLLVGNVKPLLELPDTTTIGLLWRETAAARSENAPKQANALARLLGSDVTAEDKAAIAAALQSEADARGDFQTVGIAWNGTGPTAMVRAPAADSERMKKALKQIVDLSNLASFKKALGALGIRLAVDKAVIENLPADVTRIRLSRGDADGKDAGKSAGKDAKAGAAGDKKAAPADTPKAIDLFYFVDAGSGLFAAAGYDPKDSLRALVKAPTGANFSTSVPMATALGAVGDDAAFVLVADAARVSALTTGHAPPPTGAPLVVAAGRSTTPAGLWGRVDVPTSVVQLLVEEYLRRRGAP